MNRNNKPCLRSEAAFDAQFQALEHLVLHSNLGAQRVVGVPFLGESNPVFLNFVLGFQRAEHFPGLLVRRAAGVELDAGAGLRLAVELDEPEVKALVEHVSGVLAQVCVRWRSHYLPEETEKANLYYRRNNEHVRTELRQNRRGPF